MKALSVFIQLFIFFKLQAQLISGPIELNTSATIEFADNFKGGIKQGSTYYGLEQLSINFSFENAGLWKGGNFFLHALNIHGIGPTNKFVGDMMSLSNIEASDFIGLYEFWYSQEIGKMEFLFGQHDLNSEFAETKYGENFINSTISIISNISLNVPVSTYPKAAPCILAKFNFDDHFVLKAATYDGDPGNIERNRRLDFHISSAEGLMNIMELQYTDIDPNQNGLNTSNGIQRGIYKIGAFYHSGLFRNYSDPLKQKRGNYGVYLIADRMIIPKPGEPEEGLAALLEFGYSPPKYNLIDYSIECGVRYYGLLPFQTRDFAGIAFTYASVSNYIIKNDPSRFKSECSLEFFYKIQFAKHYTIQPDFQYIIHPGAIRTVSNACVGLIRIQLEL